jgi:hypothetical protein
MHLQVFKLAVDGAARRGVPHPPKGGWLALGVQKAGLVRGQPRFHYAAHLRKEAERSKVRLTNELVKRNVGE